MPEDHQPGALEALGRGALQGVSMGFSDELAGLVESLVGKKSYAQARDESRAANDAARAAHPYLFGGGELGGGLATAVVPGLGAIKGASVAKTALQGAALGGLSAAGTSEAKDAAGLAKDVGEGAAIGGVGSAFLHGVASKVGGLLERAPELRDEQTLKALAQGEGKAGAAWSKTRGMVNDPNVTATLNDTAPFEGKTISLHDIASKPAEEVRPFIESRKATLGQGLDAIYDTADKTSGGVKVSDLVKHYDDQISILKKDPGNQPFVKALEDTKKDVLQSWAPQLADALGSEEAQNPKVKDAIMKSLDVKVPSKDVRAFATTLQDRGSETVDRLNPGVGSQVKKMLGQTTRDFVNDHVESVLGDEHGQALKALNAKMSSLYRIDDVLADRESKEAAGRISSKGVANQLLGHGGMVGGALMALHGNLPGAAAAIALPKVLEHLPQAARVATSGAVRANAVLQQLVHAAEAGNVWAQRQVQIIRSTPQGLARLAALQAPQSSLGQ